MMRSEKVIENWLLTPSSRMPPLVKAAFSRQQRYEEVGQCVSGDLPVDPQTLLQAFNQLELQLPKMNERAYARERVADYVEQTILPTVCDEKLEKIPGRLREARRDFTYGIRPDDGRTIIRWDQKAALPLLCPDDAREEAMRLQRRVVPELLRQVQGGARLHYFVLTMPNKQPGDLREGMLEMYKRFRALLRLRRNGHAKFPQITGALCVMEAPLSAWRTWNPHLNVIFVCKGYLDYKELRQAWGYNLYAEPIADDRESIERSLRELIKYALKTIPEKLADQCQIKNGSADGCLLQPTLSPSDFQLIPPDDSAVQAETPSAPAMLQYSPSEWLEWWRAHQKFRRTRAYGVLFGLKVEELEGDDEEEAVPFLDTFHHVASGHWTGDFFMVQRPHILLNLITDDKSTKKNHAEQEYYQGLGADGPPTGAPGGWNRAKRNN